jgi:hypothetical protein
MPSSTRWCRTRRTAACCGRLLTAIAALRGDDGPAPPAPAGQAAPASAAERRQLTVSWATGYWSISASRKRMRTMPNGRYGRGLAPSTPSVASILNPSSSDAAPHSAMMTYPSRRMGRKQPGPVTGCSQLVGARRAFVCRGRSRTSSSCRCPTPWFAYDRRPTGPSRPCAPRTSTARACSENNNYSSSQKPKESPDPV